MVASYRVKHEVSMRVIPFEKLEPEKGVTYTRDHLRRLVKAGKFPRPIRLSESRIAWDEAEIDSWLKARAAEREKAAA
jgi:prophage regulatory protein